MNEIDVGSRVIWTDVAKAHYYMRKRRKDTVGTVTEILGMDGGKRRVRVQFSDVPEVAYMSDLLPAPRDSAGE